MPNRMLRDWTASEKINSLTPLAERLFTRLIMKVDDYGCFYADPRILKANLFPLQLENIREADIARWTTECEKAGLIVVYDFDSKKYLEIIDFKQRLRLKNRKFPERQTDDRHMSVTRPPESEVEVEVEGNPAPKLVANHFRQPNIPTKQQVNETFLRNGGTTEMAKSFYEKYEATGWFYNNSPITNYISLAQRFITNWNKNKDKQPLQQTPSSAPLKRV